MNLKLNLKIHLTARGLTVAELSRLTGVPKTTLSDWLTGRSPKNLTHLKAVADVLYVSVDELVFDALDSPKKEGEGVRTVEAELVPMGRFDVYMKRVK